MEEKEEKLPESRRGKINQTKKSENYIVTKKKTENKPLECVAKQRCS